MLRSKPHLFFAASLVMLGALAALSASAQAQNTCADYGGICQASLCGAATVEAPGECPSNQWCCVATNLDLEIVGDEVGSEAEAMTLDRADTIEASSFDYETDSSAAQEESDPEE